MTAVRAGEDLHLVQGLRGGDEDAFRALVEAHGSAMLRVARLYVRDGEVAKEVVQEAWIGVLRGIDRFEGRSSFRTWLFRIVANTAKTRAQREGRSVPFTVLDRDEGGGPSVPADRFRGPDDPWATHWAAPPKEWSTPEERLLASETRRVIAGAIDRLPESQRAVISLRDVEGWSAEDVCNVLGISDVNERVLLHRARSSVRSALDDYMQQEAG